MIASSAFLKIDSLKWSVLLIRQIQSLMNKKLTTLLSVQLTYAVS